MASWASDGLLTGYDPITRRLQTDLYHFASPGTVDVQGATRFQYGLADKYNTATRRNKLEATAPFTLQPSDFTSNPGKNLGMAMAVCNANFFPGHIPKPSEILASPGVVIWRADTIWVVPQMSPVTTTFGWHDGYAPNGYQLQPNNKYWVLLYPTAVVDINSEWSVAHDKPLAGYNVDSVGRALSVWANRTPTAPVITSPANNTVAVPGSTVNLTYALSGKDVETPVDADKVNLDLAGVQVQYSRQPTASDPKPPWNNLPFGLLDETVYITKQPNYGTSGALRDILTELTVPILCGDENARPGKALLPGGNWRIRVRTFDFGHPYPLEVPPISGFTGWTPEQYPATNTSPWSTPVQVSVVTQVPPPLAISPLGSIAVQEGDTVPLVWQYRNTHLPPYHQSQRVVQVRKVGAPAWSIVSQGFSALSTYNLPPSLSAISYPPAEYLPDGGFEGGTVDGWVPLSTSPVPDIVAATPVEVLSVVTGGAYEGTKWLKEHYSGVLAGDTAGVYREVPMNPADPRDFFGFSGRVRTVSGTGFIGIFSWWLDADGVPIPLVVDSSSPTSAYTTLSEPEGGWASDWSPFVLNAIRRPAGASAFVMIAYTLDNSFAPMDTGFDALSVQGTYRYYRDAFKLEATTHYEWRVQVTDTDSQTSTFSEPVRFWVVPASGSGEVRPVPASTIEGATLGCGTHRAFIYRRGGKDRVGEIRGLTHVDWERIRDDISTAQINVKNWDIDCGNLLAQLQTWAYELVLVRDNGYSTDRVWEGPITLLTYKVDEVIIQAKDVMGYAYRRIIKQAMNDSGKGHGTTVTDRAARVLRNTFAPDDPNVLAYLNVLARDDDSMQYRSTPAYARTAFEEVDDMAANSGLDYTVIGRSILLWGTRHRIGTLPEFKDVDLGAPPIVSEYGMSTANRYAVSDGNGIYGEATRLDVSGNDSIYGLVEMVSSSWASDSTEDTGTYTQEGLDTIRESFEGYAERSIADRYPPPVVVRVPDNTTLNPGTVLSIQQLVPGVVVPLRSTGTLRNVVASQKLDSMKVVEEAGSETITITLSPFSRDDAAVEAEVDA